MGQGTTFEKPGLVQVPANSTALHWKFGLRQLSMMGKAPNSAVAAHSSFLWLGGLKSRTQREITRSLFHLAVTEHAEEGESTHHAFLSLFLFSSHADCSGVPVKIIRDGLSVPLSA